MTKDDAAGRDQRRLGAPPPCDYHGSHALCQVQQQGQCGETFAAGTQDVGSADIARADPADIAMTGQPVQQQAERDGAEEIAEYSGGEEGNALTLPRRRRGPLPLPQCKRGAVSCCRRKPLSRTAGEGGPGP